MKAARLHRYDESIPKDSLKVEEIDEPRIENPLDVIVRSGPPGSAAQTYTSSRASGNRYRMRITRFCHTCLGTRTQGGSRRSARQ